jgi:hypothetical protein
MPLIFTQPYILYTNSSDASYASVALLMHMDGSNGSRVFVDEKGNTVSYYGNAEISTAQSKFGGASLACGGNGRLSIPHSAALDIGASDFVIEFWFNASTVTPPYQEMFTKGAGLQIYLGGNKVMVALSANNNTIYFLSVQSGTITPGEWNHVALQKRGNQYLVFLNGQPTNNESVGLSPNTGTDPIIIGAYANGAYPFTGYIDDVRVTTGAWRYTGGFTLPTEAYPNSL